MAHRDRTDIAVPLVRRNFVLSVVNGAFITAGNRVADPATVIPLLVLRLLGAEWAVGLAAAVQQAARVGTQIIAARLLDSIPRKRPLYVWSSVVRVVCLCAATGALLSGVGRDPVLVLTLLLMALFGLMVASGVAGLAWMDINARSVPSTRRGSLMTYRRILGLVLALLISAPLVKYMLGPNSPFEFPANYGILFLASTVLCGIAWTTFSLVKEPPVHAARHRLTLRQHFVRGFRIYRRDAAYRRLLRLRVTMGLTAAVPTFFIAFGCRDLGLPEYWAAVFLTTQLISEMVGSLVFGRLSDRIGNRSVMVASAWVACATFMAATVAALPVMKAMGSQGASLASVGMLGVAFCGLGFLMSARMTGEINYMLDIAPAPKRPSYIGFGNAFLLPMSLVPILVGWLVPKTGYVLVFAAALVVSLISIALASKLQEPRETLMPEDEEAD